MNIEELEKRLSVFEKRVDHCAMPGCNLVARLRGRDFARLTNELHQVEAQFTTSFRDAMVATAEHLMAFGFPVIYAHTHGDEISVLFHPRVQELGRRVRKVDRILASEASARYSMAAGRVAYFDCHISQLPNRELIIDYFHWRSEKARRVALDAHCYRVLRCQKRIDANTSTNQLAMMSQVEKKSLLAEYQIVFDELPGWQLRGVGIIWETIEREPGAAGGDQQRPGWSRRTRTEFDLPSGEEYSEYMREVVRCGAESEIESDWVQ